MGAGSSLWGGAGAHLVDLTKKSVLSQELVKSFNFLFLSLQKQTNKSVYLLSLPRDVVSIQRVPWMHSRTNATLLLESASGARLSQMGSSGRLQ